MAGYCDAISVTIHPDNSVSVDDNGRGIPVDVIAEEGKPGPEVFTEREFHFDTLSQRLRELSFLNAGLKITILDERSGKSHEFQYKGGIASFVQQLNRSKNALHGKPIFVEREKDGVQAEVALQYNDSYQATVFAFANNINTYDGGPHLIGFRSPLTRP